VNGSGLDGVLLRLSKERIHWLSLDDMSVDWTLLVVSCFVTLFFLSVVLVLGDVGSGTGERG
jgi:hypothetical protein